jgi:hypothetical protein
MRQERYAFADRAATGGRVTGSTSETSDQPLMRNAPASGAPSAPWHQRDAQIVNERRQQCDAVRIGKRGPE